MVFDKELADMCTLSDTARTAKVISDIANSLNPSIQVTVDTPEPYQLGPNLLLKWRIEPKFGCIRHSWVSRSS